MTVLLVIAQKDFRDEELFEPLQVFQSKNNIATNVVSNEVGEHVGMLGRKITTNKTIDDVKSSDYNAIVVVGGSGSREYLWNNETLLKLINEFNDDKKVVSAICISPVVLAHAGILNGKNATVFEDNESIEEMKKSGANLLNDGVVVDGNIVTAKGPQVAKEFGEKVLELIENL
ncbi:DJ-1/PfpI/YhbO family deglycase/protease [Methanococcus voltae]|uniref:Protease I n=2 Tax=Methanococcus voltae TaxID=2188 RepID=A0A8J7S4K1_METVO|nr:DJ-1/PfpI family protein [Methanococcus voltae]MBP2171789.1 protease I [Methanococcus voltae]MBP2201273.1 protease I [Methanococcus voltae]MCS3922785.1 protease I [Methanococcus voltae PS]